jgi:hypothetical protein
MTRGRTLYFGTVVMSGHMPECPTFGQRIALHRTPPVDHTAKAAAMMSASNSVATNFGSQYSRKTKLIAVDADRTMPVPVGNWTQLANWYESDDAIIIRRGIQTLIGALSC